MCSPATFPNSDKKCDKHPVFTQNSLFARHSLNHCSPQQQQKGIVNTKHTRGCTKSLKINKRSKFPMFLCFSLFTWFQGNSSITTSKHRKKKGTMAWSECATKC